MAERRDLVLRRQDYVRIFKSVIEIVAGHERVKLMVPLAFFKGH